MFSQTLRSIEGVENLFALYGDLVPSPKGSHSAFVCTIPRHAYISITPHLSRQENNSPFLLNTEDIQIAELEK